MWNNVGEVKIKTTFFLVIGKSKYHVKYITKFMEVHQKSIWNWIQINENIQSLLIQSHFIL